MRKNYPTFLPNPINQLTTVCCINLAQGIQLKAIPKGSRTRECAVPFCAEPIDTAYVQVGCGTPLLLLHGFDSCLLEFAPLIPHLSQSYEVYALDLLGFGFTERKLGLNYNPLTIRTHLYHFCQTVIKRPMVLVGASMGGGTAIDFAVTYPELVEKLILIDSIGFSGDVSFGQFLFSPLDSLAVQFWRQRKEWALNLSLMFGMDETISEGLRVSLLPSEMPLWEESIISFMKSGGYLQLPSQIPKIQQPTLIIWGERDAELGTEDARKFKEAVSVSQLVWIKEAGHAPQWEKPNEVAIAMRRFCS